MSDSVSWLLVDELDSGRGQFDCYYERLEGVVPTPETEIIDLSTSDREPWDSEQIKSIMEQKGWNRAFVRGMQKAAPGKIESGSIIKEPTVSEIDNTLSSLFVQLSMSEWEHGGSIAVRELLDTRFCLGKNHHMCHPEIRYIIEGGDIICKIPEEVNVNCELQYDYLDDTIDSARTPDDMAREVASEFENSTWAVDFVMDTKGDWYCLEMNLNGIRWNGDTDKWINMCGYGNKTHLSPEVIHAPAIDIVSEMMNE